jgi:hypothetical protein
MPHVSLTSSIEEQGGEILPCPCPRLFVGIEFFCLHPTNFLVPFHPTPWIEDQTTLPSLPPAADHDHLSAASAGLACRPHVEVIMDFKFYTIRFKNQVGLKSDFISIYFWTKIYLELYHFVKKHLYRDTLPSLPTPLITHPPKPQLPDSSHDTNPYAAHRIFTCNFKIDLVVW